MTEGTVVRCEIEPGVSMTASVHRRSGPPIVLLHGIPGGRGTWRRVVPGLTAFGPVVVPDLLGFGDSSDPRGDFHAFAQAGAVGRLLDHVGVERVHVVGFDFGGPVSVAFAEQQPTRVASLTLVAANAFTDTPIPGPLKLAKVPVLGDALFLAMCSWPGLASMWFSAVAAKPELSWQAFRRELPARRGRRWTRRIFLDSLRHLEDRYAPIERALPRITCPTRVVWGDRDPFFAVSVGERLANAINGATFEGIRHCGHFIPLERPDALVRVIGRQLLDSPAPARLSR